MSNFTPISQEQLGNLIDKVLASLTDDAIPFSAWNVCEQLRRDHPTTLIMHGHVRDMVHGKMEKLAEDGLLYTSTMVRTSSGELYRLYSPTEIDLGDDEEEDSDSGLSWDSF